MAPYVAMNATVIGGASEVRKDLLRFFHIRPGVEGHVRSIARQIGRDPGAVSRELRRLEQQGIVASKTIGRSVVYRVATTSPLGREFRALVQRTLGVEARIRQALSDLKGIEEASIFGSYAAGSERASSDIDLLVIGNPPSDDLRRRVGAAGRDLRREINLVELTAAEVRNLRRKRDPFIRDVLSGPRVLLIAGSHGPVGRP